MSNSTPSLATSRTLPMPSLQMRELVGPTDPAAFDNPTGALVLGEAIEPERYENVLDFGCGCGRLARQMIQQNPRPKRYLGLDLHKGMIRWARQNLQPLAPCFEFQHQDVFNRGFNPRGASLFAPFPVPDHSISLFIAWSVFTHLVQEQCEYYLREAARVLRPDGVMFSTWFLFDKSLFPMMHDFQNALYLNYTDPSNAVIFDRKWLLQFASDLGLTLRFATPPVIRGFAWTLHFRPAQPGISAIELPPDTAPLGREPPPIPSRHPSTIGL